jgi:hypothetical protein
MTRRRSAVDISSTRDPGSSDLVQLLPMDLWLREMQQQSPQTGQGAKGTRSSKGPEPEKAAASLDKEKAVRRLIDRLNDEA